MLADVLAAAAASFCVAPMIAAVDQAIVQHAAGTSTMLQSVRGSIIEISTQPRHFVCKPAFLMIWGVYCGTYISANFITSACDATNAGYETRHAAKFVGVSLTNITLNVTKDRSFTRMFGVGKPRALPRASLAAFTTRDSMTVFTSFNLAPVAAEKLVEGGYLNHNTAITVAQLVCPVLVQWVSAPLHLIGLDMYNNQEGASANKVLIRERMKRVKENYVQTAIARSARIGPAFGLGALLNAPFRKRLHEMT